MRYLEDYGRITVPQFANLVNISQTESVSYPGFASQSQCTPAPRRSSDAIILRSRTMKHRDLILVLIAVFAI